MGDIGDQIEAAINAAINKHFADDEDIVWPIVVEIKLSVTIASPHQLN